MSLAASLPLLQLSRINHVPEDLENALLTSSTHCEYPMFRTFVKISHGLLKKMAQVAELELTEINVLTHPPFPLGKE